MIDGFRILIGYNHDEPFVNLKAEQLEESHYPADKPTLIDSLELMANRTPELEADKNRATVSLGGLRVMESIVQNWKAES